MSPLSAAVALALASLIGTAVGERGEEGEGDPRGRSREEQCCRLAGWWSVGFGEGITIL